jgi:hypothetical protein
MIESGRLVAIKHAIFLALLILAMGLVLAPGRAGSRSEYQGVETIDLAEIQPGMKGYGLSVFRGSAVERFEVTVVGVVPNYLPREPIILIMCGGQNLDKTMLVAGMSGSPIFIEGRLAGALAYGWAFNREPMAGVTPIKNMIGSMKKFDSPLLSSKKSSDPGAALLARETAQPRGAGDPARDPSTDATTMMPLATPLFVSGFSPGGLDLLRRDLASLNLVPVAGGGFFGQDLDRGAIDRMGPGSAVGAALVTGDISMVATGTLTYRDGDDIIGFGHPFLSAGPLRLPLVTSDINAVISNQNISFKIGSPTAIVGELVADEQTGIVGKLGREPHSVPMLIKIRRDATHYRDQYRLRIASHPAITPLLIKAVLGEIIQAASPSFDPTTVRVKTRLTLSNYGEVQYEDVYPIAKGNISAGYLEPVVFFASNPFEKIQIEEAELDLEVVDDLKVAAIESVFAASDEVEPGTTLDVGVVLRPYNEAATVMHLLVPVPKDLSARAFKIKIAGGNRAEADTAAPRSVADMITFMHAVHESTLLTVTYAAPGQGVDVQGKRLRDLPPSVASTFTPKNDTEAGDAPLLVILTEPSPYVIVGSQSLTLPVKNADAGKGR